MERPTGGELNHSAPRNQITRLLVWPSLPRIRSGEAVATCAQALLALPRAKFKGKVVKGLAIAASVKLNKFLTVADSLAKIAVVAISVYGAIYLFSTDVARQCTTVTETLYKVAQDEKFPTADEVIATLVQTADPGHCKLVEKGVPRALAAISQTRRGQAPEVTNKSEPLQGAVAVGFVDSDWSFDYANGSTNRSGVKRGDLLRAITLPQ